MPPQQPMAASYQPSHRSKGLLIAFVICVLLLLGTIGFGIWAYLERTDYKNNSDQKADAAVLVAVQEEASRKDAEFVEREKSPTRIYKGPSAYGGVSFKYPKTWSGYVVEKDKSQKQIDGFFHPGIVPDVNGDTGFALRVQVLDRPYADIIKSLQSKVNSGKLKLSAYKPKNVKGVSASRVTGEYNQGQNDTLVFVELRDKTLQIWTESNSFVGDFDKYILDSLTFSP